MLSLKRACRNNILVCIRHFQFPSAINITYRGKKGRDKSEGGVQMVGSYIYFFNLASVIGGLK